MLAVCQPYLLWPFSVCTCLAVLTIGADLSGLDWAWLLKSDFNFLALNNSIYDGFIGMFEVALLSIFLGGLSAIMQQEGGLNG